ncbi:PREDICTED: uncharacterized protein LOC109114517 [Nelumbo nucifera]|uniref:Uncharacterized protein LOC109114517 n=2 Tax=Nelumbo nucifera TaxID=4432 RepID=A0A1U8Q213_NELNU|nr:PREDICTED: uncharacterized protein LOC109114517 [Nelumbo nucifera]DAD26004.1 TPA_asm: hypothetical protein HUJ06_027472 [Nelumbo nucifera]
MYIGITKVAMLGFSMNTQAIIILLIFALSVIVSPLADGVQPANPMSHASQANCTYSIVIETTCAPSADTKGVVGVRFGDSAGNLVVVKHLKNPKSLNAPKEGARKQGGTYRAFERCAVDVFDTSGPCMSRSVCSLYLKQFGADRWRPGWVKVLHRRDDSRLSLASYLFYFRTFVPENVWFGFDYCNPHQGSLPKVPTLGGEA